MTTAGNQHASSRQIVLVEFPPAGGLYQFALQLGEGLARLGHRVDLLTGPRPEIQSREPNCRVRSLLPTWHPTAGADAPDWWRRARRGVRAGQYVLAWLILLLHLRRQRPDVVLWSAWRFPVDGWGVRVARRLLPGATLGLIAHEPRPLVEQPGQDGLYKTNPTLEWALAGAYRSLDVAYVLGDSARDVLLQTWPITAPVQVIPHGDEGVFADAEPTPVAETRPNVLFFGTITAYKGVDELLACWPQVRAAVPEATLTLAGNLGADIDAETLRTTIAALDGVTLQAGYVPVEQVAPLFNTARVVALPYRRSSQSGVAHLAYTFGRAVVASAVGDIPTVVRDQETGLLVPPGDAPALAAALVATLSDVQLAADLGTAGQALISTTASWDDVAKAVDQALPQTHPATDQLRVLQVLDSFNFGGAENLIAELGHQAPANWQLRAASLAPAGQGRDALLDRLTEAGLQPLHLGVRRLLDPIGFLALVRELRRLRPDIVHAHLGYSATLVPLAARLAGIGCVATLHHLPEDLGFSERLKERLSVQIPARLGTLILLSRPAFDGFAERHGPADEHWQLLPNGVDLDRFSGATPAELGLADQRPTWAAIAALREPKGHLDLLQAWRTVLDSGRDARLLIVGDGPQRSRIEAAIARLKLSDDVVLLGRRDDVPSILAAVDGVVSASHIEALPTALIEAGAASLPVVSTDAGGATDIVTAQTGWLVPAHAPERLADALIQAIGDPEEATLRGKAARDRVEQEFSMTTWISRLDSLYRSALRGPARRRLTRTGVISHGLRHLKGEASLSPSRIHSIPATDQQESR